MLSREILHKAHAMGRWCATASVALLLSAPSVSSQSLLELENSYDGEVAGAYLDGTDLPRGASFDFVPDMKLPPTVNCLTHDGESKVVDGTGLRIELIPLFGRPNQLSELLELLGFTAFKTTTNIISDITFGFEKWFSGDSKAFVLRVVRDDGVYRFENLRFDPASIKEIPPATNRRAWAFEKCGKFAIEQYRKQAWKAWVFRTSYERGKKRRLSDLAFALLDYQESEDMASALFRQATSPADTYILDDDVWPRPEFWEVLLQTGDVDVVEVVSGSYLITNNFTVHSSDDLNSLGLDQIESQMAEGSIPSAVTNAKIVSLDKFLPSYLRSEYSADKAQIDHVALARFTLESVDQAYSGWHFSNAALQSGDWYANSREQGPFATLPWEDLRQQIDLVERDLEEYWQDAHESPFDTYYYPPSVPSPSDNPIWNDVYEGFAPPDVAHRVAFIWSGGCDTDDIIVPSPESLDTSSGQADLENFFEGAAECGFLLPEANNSVYDRFAPNHIDVSPEAQPAFSGAIYGFPFNPPSISFKSDVLMQFSFGNSLKENLDLAVVFPSSESSANSPVPSDNIFDATAPAFPVGEDSYVVYMSCIPLSALIDGPILLGISRDGAPLSSLDVSTSIVDPHIGESSFSIKQSEYLGRDRLPDWFVASAGEMLNAGMFNQNATCGSQPFGLGGHHFNSGN